MESQSLIALQLKNTSYNRNKCGVDKLEFFLPDIPPIRDGEEGTVFYGGVSFTEAKTMDGYVIYH